MNVSKGFRQFHRWTSIVFTVTVAANFIAMTQGQPPAWITYAPLLPLFALLSSGLYLFALPYFGKDARGAGGLARAAPDAALAE